MSNVIQVARDRGNIEIEVKAPLKPFKDGATFEEYIRMPATNKATRVKTDSILSRIGGADEYTDISNTTVLMLTRDNDGSIFKDMVTVKGQKSDKYVVEIEGNLYTVRKTAVQFITGAN